MALSEKTWSSTLRPKRLFMTRVEAKARGPVAQAGSGHVFFVDAAHFVFGTFLCFTWLNTAFLLSCQVVSDSMSWVRGMQ